MPEAAAAVIEDPRPMVDGGRFPSKAAAGDRVVVSADVFTHGHDLVRACIRERPGGTRRWRTRPMTSVGNDRFEAVVVPEMPGRYEIEILGEVDLLGTWQRDATRRSEVGLFDRNDAIAGAELLRGAARAIVGGATATATTTAGATASDEAKGAASALREIASRLGAADEATLLEAALAALAALGALAAKDGPIASRRPDTTEPTRVLLYLQVQRELGACSSWYECFPRSTSPDPTRSGTLLDLVERLDYVADLGFDVLYLPPVHPIGMTGRKGPGNTPGSTDGDVGSPWAIGSAAGGHCAIAPELGTIDDLDVLVAEAGRRHLEVALDLAFQCSPDHPWVTEHPDWFAHRPDGTIACAENPPKRYEDVIPLDFSTADRGGLFRALLDVVRFWMGHGIRVFRVDNPHTKPFELWEWLIAAVHEEDPGVVFLAEAFTRPKVMHRLGKVGFDQSYTYFTWRSSKEELADYLDELAHGPGTDYFRGNLWPNTPDILATSLQHGGRPSFVARLVIAACGSANYGIYGPLFELLVDRPAKPGSEEYQGSEKYEIRQWDLDDPRSIKDVVRRVNGARKLHRALRRDSSLVLHRVDNDALLCWSKRDAQSGDAVVCVVNLDPLWPQSGMVELDLAAVGVGGEGPYVVRDLLEDASYTWSGRRNFVLLDPTRSSAHVLAVETDPSPGLLR